VIELVVISDLLIKAGVRLAGSDSDLEAFSHNPAHGSFAALVSRRTAIPEM
jgi:hypothetical protein